MSGTAQARPLAPTRRRIVASLLAFTAIGLAACAQSAPSPQTVPSAAQPTTAPTAAPGKPAATAPAVTQAPTKPSAPITWRHAVVSVQFDSAFERMAQEKGFFAARNLDVNFTAIANTNTMMPGLIGGEFDSMYTGAQLTFPAVATGAAVKIIGTNKPRVPHVLYAKKDINDLKDLYGRSVGTGALGAFAHALASATMVKEGLDPDRVQWVNVGGGPDIFKAVVGGKVDAGVAALEFEADIPAESNIKVVLPFGSRLPDYISSVMQVTDKTLLEKREAVVAFATAHTQGHRWAVDHKDETIALAVKLTGGNPGKMSVAFDRYVSNKLLDLNFFVSREAIQFSQEIGVKQKLQDQVLPIERVATWEIQQQVVKELGERKG